MHFCHCLVEIMELQFFVCTTGPVSQSYGVSWVRVHIQSNRLPTDVVARQRRGANCHQKQKGGQSIFFFLNCSVSTHQLALETFNELIK